METTIDRTEVRRRKTTAAVVLFAIAFLLMLGATLAYFTDAAVTEATVKAGTVDIGSVLQLYGIAEDGVSLGAPVPGNAIEGWSPGDVYSANWMLSNKGDKSARMSNNIVVSISRLGGFGSEVTTSTVASAISLGNASVADRNSASVPATLEFVSSSWNDVTKAFDLVYRLSDVSIQGSAEKDLPVDGAPGPLMFRTDLAFDGAAGSEYQGMTATLVNTTNAVQARGASGPVNALMPAN